MHSVTHRNRTLEIDSFSASESDCDFDDFILSDEIEISEGTESLYISVRENPKTSSDNRSSHEDFSQQSL